VLFAEADRMQSLRITPANLDNQRAAIEEEGLGLANLPYVSAAAEFGLALWEGTPYGHSPIGTEADLAALTQAEALAFHADYYAPSNAVLVIVGGFEVESARALIEETFGSLAAGAPRPAREAFEVDRRARAEVIEDPLAPFPVYAVVWHSAGARSDEALALRVIDRLLLGHSNARFARSIRGPLALDAYSVSLAFRDVGLLNYVFAPRTFASFDEIETVVRREISSLREQGPTPQELCESVRREQFERLAAIDSHEGVAAAIARGALLEENPLRFAEELRALDALDREAIRRAAKSFLVDDFLTLEIQPTGFMRWLKPVLEFLPSSVGAGLEGLLL
jgi:predicted Zn-dependent peptidase